MSIKQINKVFHDTNLKGNEKLLMLALADIHTKISHIWMKKTI